MTDIGDKIITNEKSAIGSQSFDIGDSVHIDGKFAFNKPIVDIGDVVHIKYDIHGNPIALSLGGNELIYLFYGRLNTYYGNGDVLYCYDKDFNFKKSIDLQNVWCTQTEGYNYKPSFIETGTVIIDYKYKLSYFDKFNKNFIASVNKLFPDYEEYSAPLSFIDNSLIIDNIKYWAAKYSAYSDYAGYPKDMIAIESYKDNSGDFNCFIQACFTQYPITCCYIGVRGNDDGIVLWDTYTGVYRSTASKNYLDVKHISNLCGAVQPFSQGFFTYQTNLYKISDGVVLLASDGSKDNPGIYKSSDFGDTWDLVLNADVNNSRFFTDGSYIYCINASTLYKSSDSGDSWASVSYTNPSGLSLDDSPRMYYMSGKYWYLSYQNYDSAKLYYSTGNFTSWTTINNFLSGPDTSYCEQIDYLNSNHFGYSNGFSYTHEYNTDDFTTSTKQSIYPEGRAFIGYLATPDCQICGVGKIGYIVYTDDGWDSKSSLPIFWKSITYDPGNSLYVGLFNYPDYWGVDYTQTSGIAVASDLVSFVASASQPFTRHEYLYSTFGTNAWVVMSGTNYPRLYVLKPDFPNMPEQHQFSTRIKLLSEFWQIGSFATPIDPMLTYTVTESPVENSHNVLMIAAESTTTASLFVHTYDHISNWWDDSQFTFELKGYDIDWKKIYDFGTNGITYQRNLDAGNFIVGFTSPASIFYTHDYFSSGGFATIVCSATIDRIRYIEYSGNGKVYAIALSNDNKYSTVLKSIDYGMNWKDVITIESDGNYCVLSMWDSGKDIPSINTNPPTKYIFS